MTRLGLFVMWLLHGLPMPALAACGRLLGRLLHALGAQRRHVAEVNIGLCFPGLSPAEKSMLVRRHFEMFGRCLLERGLLWWAPPERIRRMVKLEGLAHLEAARQAGQPVLLLVPHFVGLDTAWTRLTMECNMSGIYASQKNAVFDAVLYKGRRRFGDHVMLSRQDGLRTGVKAIKAGYPFFYLPDMDYGRRDAVFVPFFGVPAATITGLSRLARLTGAVVLPVISRMEDDGYTVTIGAPWPDFPGESVEADTQRMNAEIEAEILKMPEQYYWVHRRFKTRPPGEQRPY